MTEVFEVYKSGHRRLVTKTSEELTEADALTMCGNNTTEMYRDGKLVFSSGPISRWMFAVHSHSFGVGIRPGWGKAKFNKRRRAKKRGYI